MLPPSEVTGDRWIAEDLLGKRRFTISRTVATALVAAIAPDDQDALVGRLIAIGGSADEWSSTVSALLARGLLVAEVNDDHKWLLGIETAWGKAGWREAAEYHALTFDYPCIDYSEATAIGLDRSRMRAYQAEEPDDNRYKLDYLGHLEHSLPVPAASMPTRSAAELWTEAPAARSLTADQLETVLSLTFGVTEERTPVTASAPLLRRTSPSGGGRNPTEGYLLVRAVPGLKPGWHHVTLKPFGLRFLGDAADVGRLFPDLPADPAAVVVVTSLFERNMYRYREPRTFRTVHMDAGHLIATGRMVAEAVGLHAVAGDGGDGQAIEEDLGLDGMAEGYLCGLGIYENRPAATPRPIRPEPDAAGIAVQHPDWLVGTRVRAHGETAEVADTVLGATAHLRPDELANTIFAGKAMAARAETLADQGYRAKLVDGLRHWQHRRWHPSDQFFTAARRMPPAPGAVTEPPPELPGPGIDLPSPASPGDQSLAALLLARRSGRAFMRKPVPATTLSSVLWHGLAEFRDGRRRQRSAAHWEPVAWRVCVCVFDVDGIAPGAYHYDPAGHRLHLAVPGDHRTEMIRVLQGMRTPSSAGWTLGLVADLPRAQQAIPGESGLRSVYTWSGVIAQELIILGGAHGLSTLVTPAQRDSDYLGVHDLPKDRYTPIYTLTMGLSRGADGVYPDDQPAQGES